MLAIDSDMKGNVLTRFITPFGFHSTAVEVINGVKDGSRRKGDAAALRHRERLDDARVAEREGWRHRRLAYAADRRRVAP